MIFKDPKSRRMFLQLAGFQLALPFLASALPKHLRAAPNGKKFIGVFFPNGVYMPQNSKGVWHWDNANGILNTFKNNSDIHNNIMIVRNLTGFTQGDQHFNNTPNFLSAKLPRPLHINQPRVGESLDQMFAKQSNKPINSINVPPHREGTFAVNVFSQTYLNRISWSSISTPTPVDHNPQILFNKINNISPPANNIITSSKELYRLNKKKLILDTALPGFKKIRAIASKADKLQLESFENSLEEILKLIDLEKQNLNQAKPICENTPPQVGSNLDFAQRMRLYQKLIVHAMKCDLTDVATIMYGTGIGNGNPGRYPGLPTTHAHHQLSHFLNYPRTVDAVIREYNLVSQLHVNLLKELLVELKQTGLLDNTLVLYSSNMSSGTGHDQTRYPTLLAGGNGFNFKFGQDVSLKSQPRSNLLYTIGKELGVKNGNVQTTDFGAHECTVTGNINEIYRS